MMVADQTPMTNGLGGRLGDLDRTMVLRQRSRAAAILSYRLISVAPLSGPPTFRSRAKRNAPGEERWKRASPGQRRVRVAAWS